ncbi:MAG: hypothetical protein ACHQRM_05815 [Bacteroidia bacterium]
MRPGLLILLIAITFYTCKPRRERAVIRCFYHWKGQFELGDKDKERLEHLGVARMYVRFFDVDDGLVKGPVPKGEVELSWLERTSCKLIPVVFITNRALLCLKDTNEVMDLAGKIYHKIKGMIHYRPAFVFDELQLDCDWTAKTKKNYFCLIRSLHQMGLKMSVTLRLWQLKDPVTSGVPPAARVMLMAYNLSAPEKPRENNSILDPETLKQYLDKSGTYPLPSDVALPLFSWGKLFRDGSFMGLINNLTEQDLLHSKGFKKTRTHEFVSSRDTVIGNFFLREGDLIRVEEVDPAVLSKAAGMISDYLKEDSLNVAFYHYDTLLINRYGNELLEKIYRRFR